MKLAVWRQSTTTAMFYPPSILLWVGLWCALAVFGTCIYQNIQDPRGAVVDFTSDHISHLNEAVLFWYRGLQIYRPSRSVCNRPQDLPVSTMQRQPDDCYLRERNTPAHPKPLVINWSAFAKPYPLGLFISMLPLGLLWEYHVLSENSALSLTVGLYHVYTLLFLLVLGYGLLIQVPQTMRNRWQKLAIIVVHSVVFLLCGFEALYVGLAGFYDNFYLALVIVSLLGYQRQAFYASLFFYSCAFFMHFRALYYFPLVLFVAVKIVRSGRWPQRHQWMLLGLSAAMLLSSFAVLTYLRQELGRFPLTNALHYPQHSAVLGIFLLFVICLLSLLMDSKQYLTAACFATTAAFLLKTVQVQEWHMLASLPLLVSLVNPKPQLSHTIWLTSFWLITYFIFFNHLVILPHSFYLMYRFHLAS